MKRILARLQRLEAAVAELARAAGVTDLHRPRVTEDFLAMLPLETRRAVLEAMHRWQADNGIVSVAERLRVSVPFGELPLEPAIKEQIRATWQRWQARDRLPCGLKDLAAHTAAAAVEPSTNGVAEPTAPQEE
jgi:hypothetical protein